ncbi:MAG: hypothetical protein HQL31_07745 [Planctomycetes bacterium]|nr:hypothetical protein [Planctomycetota bacterium]
MENWTHLYELAQGQVALLTIAPECPGALDVIADASSKGVVVSVGHSNATSADITRAVEAGATMATHLGNGCPSKMDRHANPIWAILDSPLIAMLIADGHHLPDPVLRSFWKILGRDRCVLSSDCAPPAGLQPGRYRYFGGTEALLEPSGRLRNLHADTLAGSAATLETCVNHMQKITKAGTAELNGMARDLPLQILGRTT